MTPADAKFMQFLKANCTDVELELYLQMMAGTPLALDNAQIIKMLAAKFAMLEAEYAKTLPPAEQTPAQPAQTADESDDIRLGKPYGPKPAARQCLLGRGAPPFDNPKPRTVSRLIEMVRMRDEQAS
jgi:hypothetical protein